MAELSRLLVAAILAVSLLSIWAMRVQSYFNNVRADHEKIYGRTIEAYHIEVCLHPIPLVYIMSPQFLGG
jgi:hypothetical protein